VLNSSGQWEEVHYCLFSRSGFTAQLQKRADSEGVLLVHLFQME